MRRREVFDGVLLQRISHGVRTDCGRVCKLWRCEVGEGNARRHVRSVN